MTDMLKFLTPTILISNVCTAFEENTVGTTVFDKKRFGAFLLDALGLYSFPELGMGVTSGQGFVQFPKEWLPELNEIMYSGVGLNEGRKDDDYIVRTWRGQRGHFLKREFSAPLEGVACVVYTREAYLKDPDVMKNEKYWRAVKNEPGIKYVIVAVLGFAGPKTPLGHKMFVHNISGGNSEFIPKTEKFGTLNETLETSLRRGGKFISLGYEEGERWVHLIDTKLLDTLCDDVKMMRSWITQAKEIEEYWAKYSIVAD